MTACLKQLPAGESDEATWKKCYAEKMKENEDECCMPKSEIGKSPSSTREAGRREDT